jgi:ribonuclease D
MGFLPRRLETILRSDRVFKVGHSLNTHDDKKLWQDYRVAMDGIEDLLPYARNCGFSRASLSFLSEAVLGMALDKDPARSAWDDRYLTLSQVTYAATDAWVTREIWIELSK